MSMQFCQGCSNLMYPTSRDKKLIYICKACYSSAEVTQPLVFKHTYIKTDIGTTAMPNKDIILDPTLPRDPNLRCPNCSRPEPCYFQPSEESMELIYVCRNKDCVKMGKLNAFVKIQQ
eukprot:UN04133